jgi:putative component of membrane protein insertase Oxa1/YidC/SpoIIIJ protein YidD
VSDLFPLQCRFSAPAASCHAIRALTVSEAAETGPVRD